MRVWIDQDYCTGSGLCQLIEPRVFAIGGDGLARVHASEVPPECEDEVRDAAESCPGGCIRLEPRPLSRTYASFPPTPRKTRGSGKRRNRGHVNETAPVLVLGCCPSSRRSPRQTDLTRP
jgi:ferredoxin